jgi:hypothetical protein
MAFLLPERPLALENQVIQNIINRDISTSQSRFCCPEARPRNPSRLEGSGGFAI